MFGDPSLPKFVYRSSILLPENRCETYMHLICRSNSHDIPLLVCRGTSLVRLQAPSLEKFRHQWRNAVQRRLLFTVRTTIKMDRVFDLIRCSSRREP